MSFAKIAFEGQSWELICLHEHVSCLTRGLVSKEITKSSFQRNFFQNGTHLNKLLYHWTANYCDKQVNHCPYTFSSIWPSCFCKVKHTGDSCNGVDRLVQWCRSLRNDWWIGTESQSRFLAFLCKFRHFTLHTLTGRSSINCVQVFWKNISGSMCSMGKHSHPNVSTHTCTWKLDLIM